MGLNLQESKELENHKGYWTVVSNIQKVGYEVPALVLKTLTLISGGAMVGILTFLGNLWTRDDQLARQVGKDMSVGMFWFGVALGLSLVAGFLGWLGYHTVGHVLAQNFFKGIKSKIRYAIYPLLFAVMICTAAALASFLYGMYQSFNGLLKHV